MNGLVHLANQEEEEEEEEELAEEERYADVDSEEELIFDMSDDEREEYITEKRKRKQMESDNKIFRYNYDENGKIPKQNTEEPKDPRLKEIIHRTAKFIVSNSNPHMEITIQVKQSQNPDFRFLNKEDPLYPYYEKIKRKLTSGSTDEEKYSDVDKDKNHEEGDIQEQEDDVKNDQAASSKNSSEIEVSSNQSNLTFPVDLPPELAPIMTKTAFFVAENGLAFEKKLAESTKDDDRFAFLNSASEWHVWYRDLCAELHNMTPSQRESTINRLNSTAIKNTQDKSQEDHEGYDGDGNDKQTNADQRPKISKSSDDFDVAVELEKALEATSTESIDHPTTQPASPEKKDNNSSVPESSPGTPEYECAPTSKSKHRQATSALQKMKLLREARLKRLENRSTISQQSKALMDPEPAKPANSAVDRGLVAYESSSEEDE